MLIDAFLCEVSNRNRVLLVLFLVLISAQFTSAVIFFAHGLQGSRVAQNASSFVVLKDMRIATGLLALVDTALAVTLIFLLRRRKAEFRSMNSAIDRMQLSFNTNLLVESWTFVVGTGLITGAWALVALVTSFIWPNNFVGAMLIALVPKRE